MATPAGDNPLKQPLAQLSRRRLLFQAAGGFGGLALMALSACSRRPAGESSSVAPGDAADRLGSTPGALPPPGTSRGGPARHVIFLYMDGGPSQIDTFDPKPRLDREHGRPIQMDEVPATQFNIGNRVLRSPYRFAQYGQSGAWVSEIFPHVAQCVDELAIVRSMVSDHSEHTAANYLLNTGWPVPGRPSIGSWLTYGLGTESDELPGFVVLDAGQWPLGGVECLGCGFLPAAHQPTLFRQGPEVVADLQPPEPSSALQRAKLDLVARLNRRAQQLGPHEPLEAVINNYELAFRMQSAVPALVDLSDETARTEQLYGLDRPETEVFGRQCLLARRLVERGVRFVQLLPPPLPEHNHWDQHSHLADHHRTNAEAVDRPIAGLLRDLRQRGLLDETLVIWGGEFGRTPMAQEAPQGKDGRDHNPFGFTMWLAGGGVRPGVTYGATDDYGYFAVENPVHIHDLHATVLQLLGIDHTELIYRYGGRDFRLTDVYGDVVQALVG